MVITRSILHGYFNPLVFWYQWEYLLTSKEFVIFCRVSKIGNDIFLTFTVATCCKHDLMKDLFWMVLYRDRWILCGFFRSYRTSQWEYQQLEICRYHGILYVYVYIYTYTYNIYISICTYIHFKQLPCGIPRFFFFISLLGLARCLYSNEGHIQLWRRSSKSRCNWGISIHFWYPAW